MGTKHAEKGAQLHADINVKKCKLLLTFSFINCSTEKASASLRSSPNALIKELRTKILGFIPSALMTLNVFIACSDKPCRRIRGNVSKRHDKRRTTLKRTVLHTFLKPHKM